KALMRQGYGYRNQRHLRLRILRCRWPNGFLRDSPSRMESQSSYLLDSGGIVGVVMHNFLHCVTGDHLISHAVARHKPFSYVLLAMTQYIVLGERGSVSREPP